MAKIEEDKNIFERIKDALNTPLPGTHKSEEKPEGHVAEAAAETNITDSAQAATDLAEAQRMETAQQAWAESEKATSEATTAATSTTETTAAAALPTWSISEDLLAGVRATPSQVAETPVATTPPATPAPAAEVQQVAEVKAAAPKIHVVVPGDTLSGIAYQHYGHASLWPKIFEANTDKISNPNLIYPGQELVIPEV